MKKQFIRVGAYTINLQQIAFIEHHAGKGILVVFTGRSDRGRLDLSIRDPESELLLKALEG